MLPALPPASVGTGITLFGDNRHIYLSVSLFLCLFVSMMLLWLLLFGGSGGGGVVVVVVDQFRPLSHRQLRKQRGNSGSAAAAAAGL